VDSPAPVVTPLSVQPSKPLKEVEVPVKYANSRDGIIVSLTWTHGGKLIPRMLSGMADLACGSMFCSKR
jgi:hypothetical protein